MSQLLTRMVGSAILLTALPFTLSTPAQAGGGANGYSCGATSNGTPATMARTSKGNDVAVIQFKSQHFSDSGWTPERRCQEVSQRFDTLNSQGLLRQAFLTTGRKNGQNIICVAAEKGAPCISNGILFTLRPGSDPNKTLKDLTNWAKFQTGPLSETTSRPYYGLDEILATAESNLKPKAVGPSDEATPINSGESLMP